MKNLKVTINRSAGVKKYEVLPRQEKDMLDIIRIDDLQLLQEKGTLDNAEQKIPLSRLWAWGVGMNSVAAVI